MSFEMTVKNDGEPINLETFDGGGTISVEFNGGATWECQLCDEEFDTEDADGQDCRYADCSRDNDIADIDHDCANLGDECEYPHDIESQTPPLSWLSSAEIDVNEDDDFVDLSFILSEGTASTLTVRMYRSSEGRIILALPHPDDPGARPSLTPIRDGIYGVNDPKEKT